MAGEILPAALAASGPGAITPAGWLMAGSQVLSAALAPSPSPAYSQASQYVDQAWDFGNWTVATGEAEAKGGTSGLNLSPWLLGGLALAALLVWKSKKS